MTTNPNGIQSDVLQYMAAGFDKGMQGFERRTGKFLAPNGGWAVTHQDRIYALATLWATPGTAWHGRRSVFDAACRGGDALRDMQEADGRWEFVKIDGSRWGKTYMPWSIYHWAETYVLLREKLTSTRRTQWETGLRLAYEGLARELQTPCAHNIPTWNGMSLVRGALIFGQAEWAAIGKRQIEYAVREQNPAGFWAEGAGPTNGYNHVYIHALGLYYAFTGDQTVLRPLQRAADFHAAFTYPDGSGVETIDGRQPYTSGASVMGWPGLTLFPQGRRLVRLAMDALRKERPGGGLVPHLATAFRYLSGGDEAPIAADQDGRTVFHGRALVRRQGPWFICVNGFTPENEARGEVARNRWIKTRSNNLSIWHDSLGLLVGGGHSKNDPMFSTFEIWEDGAQRLEPDGITFRQTRDMELITLRFGRTRCRLRLIFAGPRAMTVGFESDAAKGVQARGGFTLRIRNGEPLAWQSGGRKPVKAENVADARRAIAVAWSPGQGYVNPRLTGEEWRIHMPEASRFSYPVYPFNPYAIDNASPPEHGLGVIDVPLPKRNTVATFRIEVPAK